MGGTHFNNLDVFFLLKVFVLSFQMIENLIIIFFKYIFCWLRSILFLNVSLCKLFHSYFIFKHVSSCKLLTRELAIQTKAQSGGKEYIHHIWCAEIILHLKSLTAFSLFDISLIKFWLLNFMVKVSSRIRTQIFQFLIQDPSHFSMRLQCSRMLT